MVKLSIRDIKHYFETATMEVAEVAHELITGVIAERQRKSAAVSKNLAKARASKGKATNGDSASVAAPVAAPANSQSSTNRHRQPQSGGQSSGQVVPANPEAQARVAAAE